MTDYQTRITLDLDGKDYSPTGFRLQARKMWHNLGEIADDRDVHVSSSGRGLHFVGWFVSDLDQREQVDLRRALGDDPRRTDMDVQRHRQGLYTDVLFSDKSNRQHTKERRFSDVSDALDHVDALRDDSERMRRLVNHGHRGAPELARRA